MTIDRTGATRELVLRWEGVTAVFTRSAEGTFYWLCTLNNTRPRPATFRFGARNGEVKAFALRPFQKLAVYPPLMVAREALSVAEALFVD
jgi:hypothetical protein